MKITLYMPSTISKSVSVSSAIRFSGLNKTSKRQPLTVLLRCSGTMGIVMIATVQEDSLETARDVTTTIGRIREPETSGAVVELHGEFDAFDLQRLRNVLDGTPGYGRSVRVDLSGVTFLDVRCARELVIRCLFRGGRLALHNPSWQAAASLEASEHAQTTAPFGKAKSRSTETGKSREPSGRARAGHARIRG